MKPEKNTSWLQGLYTISSTEKEIVGTVRRDLWGNVYRYAKAGATALAAGKLTVAADADTDVQNCVAAAAVAIGGKTVTLTVTSTTVAENYFRGGSLQVNDATGEGHRYPVLYSSAVAAGTSCTVTLEEGVRVALTTSSECTLMQSPWMGTVISATDQTDMPTGVPMVAVTANYYYWSQTGGDACVLMDEAVAKGAMCTIGSAVAGAVEAVDAVAEPVVCLNRETGVDTEYCPVWLMIN